MKEYSRKKVTEHGMGYHIYDLHFPSISKLRNIFMWCKHASLFLFPGLLGLIPILPQTIYAKYSGLWCFMR